MQIGDGDWNGHSVSQPPPHTTTIHWYIQMTTMVKDCSELDHGPPLLEYEITINHGLLKSWFWILVDPEIWDLRIVRFENWWNLRSGEIGGPQSGHPRIWPLSEAIQEGHIGYGAYIGTGSWQWMRSGVTKWSVKGLGPDPHLRIGENHENR